MLTKENFVAFTAILDSAEHREGDCTPFLEFATDFLLGRTPAKTYALKTEERSFYGRSDYIVIADVVDGVGQLRRIAVFWELKSPQSFLLERDDAQNRFRPTKSLMKAETQLLHYVHEASGSDDFRERYDLKSRQDIYVGGIIIGRDGKIINSNSEEESNSARHCFNIRNERIYKPSRISVLTWDRIAEVIQPRGD